MRPHFTVHSNVRLVLLSSYISSLLVDGPCIKIIEDTVQSTSEPSRPAYGIRPPPVSIPPNVKEFLDVHRPTNSEQIRMLAEKVSADNAPYTGNVVY